MKKRVARYIISAVQLAALFIYFVFMLLLGEDSVVDLLSPYFFSLNFIIAITPLAIEEDMLDDEWKARIILNAFAAAAVVVPGIIFLCGGSEFIGQILKVRGFWSYFPTVVFIADAIISLIIIAVFKRGRKISE